MSLWRRRRKDLGGARPAPRSASTAIPPAIRDALEATVQAGGVVSPGVWMDPMWPRDGWLACEVGSADEWGEHANEWSFFDAELKVWIGPLGTPKGLAMFVPDDSRELFGLLIWGDVESEDPDKVSGITIAPEFLQRWEQLQRRVFFPHTWPESMTVPQLAAQSALLVSDANGS